LRSFLIKGGSALNWRRRPLHRDRTLARSVPCRNRIGVRRPHYRRCSPSGPHSRAAGL